MNSLAKYEPIAGLRSFNAFNELDRLFNWDEDFGLNVFRPLQSNKLSTIAPKIDVWETEDKVVAEVECAGLTPKDIDISVKGNTLTIRGEKRDTTEENKNGYHVMERSYGKFVRSFNMPSVVNPEGVEATAKNGIVRIEMTKREEYKPKKIEVKELTENTEAET